MGCRRKEDQGVDASVLHGAGEQDDHRRWREGKLGKKRGEGGKKGEIGSGPGGDRREVQRVRTLIKNM